MAVTLIHRPSDVEWPSPVATGLSREPDGTGVGLGIAVGNGVGDGGVAVGNGVGDGGVAVGNGVGDDVGVADGVGATCSAAVTVASTRACTVPSTAIDEIAACTIASISGVATAAGISFAS
jgi:hypothetical protein